MGSDYDEALVLLEEEYGEITREKVEGFYSNQQYIPEGDPEDIKKKIDSYLPNIHSDKFLREPYEDERLNKCYSILFRYQEANSGRLGDDFYVELDPKDFEDLESVYLDHNVLLDLFTKNNRTGPFKGHYIHWSSTLDIIDNVEEIQRSFKRPPAVKAPSNFYDIKRNKLPIAHTENYYSSKASRVLKRKLEHFEIEENYNEDIQIAEKAAEENSLIVTTDHDFLDISEEYDISVYPPDLAELGLRRASEIENIGLLGKITPEIIKQKIINM